MRLITAFFVFATLPTVAFACPSSEDPAFDWMINNSTLIVRGEVVRGTGSNEVSPRVSRNWSDIRIERTYKGTAPEVIRVRWVEYPMCARVRLHKGDYGLFFLRRNGSEFVLADEQFGKLSVSRWQDLSPSSTPSVAIDRDLKRGIQNGFGRRLIEDVLIFGSLRRPTDTAELRRLLPAKDAVLESAVHLSLLKLHDYSLLQTAGKLAESAPESHTFVFPAQEADFLRMKVGSEIGLIKDPAQLPVLQGFLLSPNYWLRDSAGRAVHAMHDSSTVRYLIGLLDDPSKERRHAAMRGLRDLLKSELDGFGWLPGVSGNVPDVTEKEALARWRTWWQTKGRAKYGK